MTVTNIETKTRSKMSNGERLFCPILFLAGLKLILQQPFFAEFFQLKFLSVHRSWCHGCYTSHFLPVLISVSYLILRRRKY